MGSKILGLVREVAACFAIDGRLLELRPLRRGHIHDTFVSTWHAGAGKQRFLHQRMNVAVFPDLKGLMHNIERVTRHLREQRSGEDELETLTLVPTRDGRSYLEGRLGAWRTYHFIDGTCSHDHCGSSAMATEAARAFGRFLRRLASLDPAELQMIIPHFFSTAHRLQQFDEALEQDACGRDHSCRYWIDFVNERRGLADPIESALVSGLIPTRVIHGDTKLNNVLFDELGGHVRAVVDLDTCMPGYSLYDFGDLVRFTAATSKEDEPDLTRVGLDLDLYAALVGGYLDGAGDSLSREERKLMPLAARLVTFTVGVRFLTDHLRGDQYFKIAHAGHNLERARVQLRLVERMEELEEKMRVELIRPSE